MKNNKILNPIFKKALNLVSNKDNNFIKKTELIKNLIHFSNTNFSEILQKKKELNECFFKKIENEKIVDKKCINLVNNILELNMNNKIIYLNYVRQMDSENLQYESYHGKEDKNIVYFHNMIILSYIFNTYNLKNSSKIIEKIETELNLLNNQYKK